MLGCRSGQPRPRRPMDANPGRWCRLQLREWECTVTRDGHGPTVSKVWGRTACEGFVFVVPFYQCWLVMLSASLGNCPFPALPGAVCWWFFEMGPCLACTPGSRGDAVTTLRQYDHAPDHRGREASPSAFRYRRAALLLAASCLPVRRPIWYMDPAGTSFLST